MGAGRRGAGCVGVVPLRQDSISTEVEAFFSDARSVPPPSPGPWPSASPAALFVLAKERESDCGLTMRENGGTGVGEGEGGKLGHGLESRR